MSDLLEAAAAAMNVPATLVERSAQARADASGSTLEEVLSAWSGGGSVPTSAPPAEEETADEAIPEEPSEPAEEPAETPAPSEEAPLAAPEESAPVVTAPVATQPEEVLEPVPLRQRVAASARVGAIMGALLGLIGLVAASPWLLPLASVTGGGEGQDASFGSALDVAVTPTVIGTILFSVVFGVIVAAFSQTATAWRSRSLALTSRPVVSVLVGAILGALLGAAAGALLTGAFGTPIENSEGFVTLSLVPTILVLLAGGAVLGAVVASVVGLLGVPEGVDEEELDEAKVVRSRLGAAFGIPLLAAIILALLVLPMGWILIQSEELTTGGAAVIAIFVAGGVLGVASLSTSVPNMRIGFREAMVGIAGLATVVLIVFAVITAQAPPEAREEAGTEEEGAEGTGASTTIPPTTTAG